MCRTSAAYRLCSTATHTHTQFKLCSRTNTIAIAIGVCVPFRLSLLGRKHTFTMPRHRKTHVGTREYVCKPHTVRSHLSVEMCKFFIFYLKTDVQNETATVTAAERAYIERTLTLNIGTTHMKPRHIICATLCSRNVKYEEREEKSDTFSS